MDKTILRRTFRKQRNDFMERQSPASLSLAFSKAPSPLANMFTQGRIVAGYIAIGSEVSPDRLLAEAQAAGARLALPHVISKSQPMRFLEWSHGTPLEEGPFGLLQPSQDAPVVKPDLCLIPLTAFDRDGNRLGQGAGHYDRALSLLPETMRIGLAWSVQEAEALPADPWDEPLHAICTEKEWIVV